jgi:acylphosphatase
MSGLEPTTEQRGFRVSGRVQGVGFRWSAARIAEGLGLRGSIRNAPDGTVEVSVEGQRAVLDRFARWLAEGPRGAVVERVENTAPELPIPESGFKIVR